MGWSPSAAGPGPVAGTDADRQEAPPDLPVLVATKLAAPVRRRRVSRAGLVGLLREGSSGRLTLIDAPAGWGKTTLLAEWHADELETRPFAWLSLDRDDNDATRFWAYLIEALRTVQAGLGAGALAALRARGGIVEAVVPLLVNDLAGLPGQVVLVLDDYHLVGNREIHEAVAFLLERMPPTLHLVLATRSDPPLPLPRLRARGELSELRAHQLRFSEAEAAALLNDVLGLGLPAGQVRRLHQRTEGWAAGLYLAALSLRGRADMPAFIAAFAGDDRHVVDYLATEVLGGQPGEVRTFLLRTSILDRLCGSLCDAVTGQAGSAGLLARIEAANLFLVPLDSRRAWYRYHHLFGELLQHELRRAEPDLVATLHRRASAWCRDAGLVDEAVHHATAAGDVADAAELVARHWNAVFNQGRLETVGAWLDALPAGTVAGDPRLCLARAWVAMDMGRLDQAGSWVEQAERARAAQPAAPTPAWDDDAPLEIRTAVLRAVHRFKIGDVGQAGEVARRALELVGEAAFWRTVAWCMRGVTLYWRGAPAEAAAALGEAVRLARSSGNHLGESYALGYLAMLHADSGELDEADRLAAAAAGRPGQPGPAEHFVAMLAHLAAGKVRQRQGRLDEARDAFSRAVELSRRGAGRVEVAAALLALAQARHGLGDRRAARALLDETREVVGRCADPGTVAATLAGMERTVRPPARPARATAQASPELSDRELAVLRLLPSDRSLRQIGAELYVSINTVKTHAKGVYAKLGASTRAEAVDRARQLGLLEAPGRGASRSPG